MDVLSADHDREPQLDSTPFFRPKPDGDLNPAGEAGWYLQREREKRGLSLDQISEATGIHPYHVEAIEMGDLTRLPQRLGLSMRTAARLGPAAADHAAVLHDDAANRRIGRDLPQPARGQREGRAHEREVVSRRLR